MEVAKTRFKPSCSNILITDLIYTVPSLLSDTNISLVECMTGDCTLHLKLQGSNYEV